MKRLSDWVLKEFKRQCKASLELTCHTDNKKMAPSKQMKFLQSTYEAPPCEVCAYPNQRGRTNIVCDK